MNPLFFGPSEAPLFGVYHPPAGQQGTDGVLLCYPFGQEYMRAHRANRQLAMLLAKQGFHVMRFDYSGTGNSSGDLRAARVDTWISDIATAAEELRETAPIKRLHIVGLRLGGLLGARACEKLDVDRLVLWDPVNSGQAYEEELMEVMHLGDEAESNYVDQDGTLYFNGFGLAADLRSDLKQLNLLDTQPSSQRVFHIVSDDYEQGQKLKQAWDGHKGYEYSLTPAPGDWNYVDDFGGILLPQPIIQAIVGWFSKDGTDQ